LNNNGEEIVLAAGLDSYITLLSLKDNSIITTFISGGGSIWDVSKAPDHFFDSEVIAVACEDGSIKIYEITLNDFNLHSLFITLLGPKTRVVCLTWGNEENDEIVIWGATYDGKIFCWNIPKEPSTHKIISHKSISLDKGFVWSMAINGNQLITGDSLGRLTIWDTITLTQIQRIHKHQFDIMSIVLNEEGNILFSAGVDNMVSMYTLDKKKKKWKYFGFRREHTHDIHCLSISNSIGILISGGIDTSLYIYKISTFTSLPPLKLLPFPTHPTCKLTIKKEKLRDLSLLLVQHLNWLEVWTLATPVKQNNIEDIKDGTTLNILNKHSMLLRIQPKCSAIQCSIISAKAQYIAYSDRKQTKVFHLTWYSEKAKVRVHRFGKKKLYSLQEKELFFMEIQN